MASAITCTPCTADKSTTNHLEHVRKHMLRVYGHDHCLRKGCEEPIVHLSGYCAIHHEEWIHAENARNFALLPEQARSLCPKCQTREKDPKGYGYCRPCRKDVNREYVRTHRRI